MAELQEPKLNPAERNNIRRWILKVVEDSKEAGTTIQQIKKFLESKKDGLADNPQVKVIMTRLLDTGHIKKSDNRKYVAKLTSGGKVSEKTLKAGAKKTSPSRAKVTSGGKASEKTRKAGAKKSSPSRAKVTSGGKASEKTLKAGAKKSSPSRAKVTDGKAKKMKESGDKKDSPNRALVTSGEQ